MYLSTLGTRSTCRHCFLLLLIVVHVFSSSFCVLFFFFFFSFSEGLTAEMDLVAKDDLM